MNNRKSGFFKERKRERTNGKKKKKQRSQQPDQHNPKKPRNQFEGMIREGIGGILAGIGLLFALATCISSAIAISSWDFYWYIQSGSGVEERYSWDGRELYMTEASGRQPIFVRFDSWSQLGFQALPKLYSTTNNLMIASISFSGLGVLAFLAVGCLRWLYRYQSVHLDEETSRRNGERNEDANADDDAELDANGNILFQVKPTYRSCRSNRLIRYFADRKRYAWALLIIEGLCVLLSLLGLVLLIAAIALFANEHSDKMKADMSLTGCISPGPCDSLAGDHRFAPSVQARSWRPGVGWAWATATTAFAAGALLVAVAQLTVRNNRFSDQDSSLGRRDLERADHHGYYFSEFDLLAQSHVWQGQEKAFHHQDGWYHPLVEPNPFPPSETRHTREEA